MELGIKSLFRTVLAAGILGTSVVTAVGMAPPSREKQATDVSKDLTELDEVSETCWTELRGKRLYFAHQSVGSNILKGVTEILKQRPSIGLQLATYRPETTEKTRAEHSKDGKNSTSGDAEKKVAKEKSSDHASTDTEHAEPDAKTRKPPFESPALVHGPAGPNGNPKQKIDDFVSMLRSSNGEKIDIAMLKFCYADVDRSTDVEQLFEQYVAGIDTIRKERPTTRILHCTIPLKAPETGAKAQVKKLVGASGNTANAQRGRYNELLRAKYGRESIFDVAHVESERPDGSICTVTVGRVKWPAMAAEYSEDGGHLNATGQFVVGRELLLTLARQCVDFTKPEVATVPTTGATE